MTDELEQSPFEEKVTSAEQPTEEETQTVDLTSADDVQIVAVGDPGQPVQILVTEGGISYDLEVEESEIVQKPQGGSGEG